ncbi:MAG: malto-oligosyltrehalose synthase [Chitinophagaceae bacterium]|nr:malto-oligosyltrehalose synthase [Chitinophagaceae bacterium]
MQLPVSTYRIQFNPRFTFRHLADIADYLEDLGITTIYASPLLQPTQGSDHGYDGINPAALNPEIGTVEEWESLSKLLQQKGINWIQDIVPNHLAFHTDNVWLRDVLERGINSPYAGHFDIDWEHPFYQQKLMVPFLESELEDCIVNRKLELIFCNTGLCFQYYQYRYPLNADSYPFVLSGCFDSEENPANALINALINSRTADTEHWQHMKEDLLRVLMMDPTAGRIHEKVEAINNDAAQLSRLLHMQHYSLCYFGRSHTEINYRRFFNVNALICLRVEEEQVFQDYHRFTFELYQKGLIQGLRVDHIDGLKDPQGYIDRLRQMFGKDCYIIVEKILDAKEKLPPFDIQGTSGYEFLSYINQLITDTKGSDKLISTYKNYIPEWTDYETVVFNNKMSNLESYLNGEWDNLLRLLLSLNLIDDEEIRLQELKMALGVFMASYPVYRAYVTGLPLNECDESMVKIAFDAALERYPNLHYELDVLRQVFTNHPDSTREANRITFIQRLMQFTGPLAAKGVEDTTFYQFNPLISHNEVGDNPCELGIPVRDFHTKMEERAQTNPYSMNCTSTHDTKRGEDGRIRINIISEMVDEWDTLVKEWKKINEPYRQQAGDILAPVANDEYFLYQAIVGGFPEDLELTEEFITRTKNYYTKVLRESKRNSDHINPNIPYEEACHRFIEHLLNPKHDFLPSIRNFVKKLLPYANIYTMVQVIVKTTAPGIPDIYRGCELWDISYVDPDNRRPVDYVIRKKLVNELRHLEAESLEKANRWAMENFEIGATKLFVTRKLLRLRKSKPDLFLNGHYRPVHFGNDERRVIAYLRHHKTDWLLVILPLGIARETDKPLHISLPDGTPTKWVNIFTGTEVQGREMDVHALHKDFPVAVLQPA